MGNRAVITNEAKEMGVYVHWNGGRDSIEALLKYCELQGFRTPDSDDYGWARMVQVLTNYHDDGLSVGIMPYSTDAMMNPGDNGIYIIKGWEIADRILPYEGFREQLEYPMLDMMCAYDRCMPVSMQKGRAAIAEFLGVEEDHNDDYAEHKVKAVHTFLEQRGIVPLDGFEFEGFNAQVTFYDDGDFVFGFIVDKEEDRPSREDFEAGMTAYIAAHPEVGSDGGTRVRGDVFCFTVFDGGHALLKRHVNAFATD